jgi:hypothetical protein
MSSEDAAKRDAAEVPVVQPEPGTESSNPSPFALRQRVCHQEIPRLGAKKPGFRRSVRMERDQRREPGGGEPAFLGPISLVGL